MSNLSKHRHENEKREITRNVFRIGNSWYSVKVKVELLKGLLPITLDGVTHTITPEQWNSIVEQHVATKAMKLTRRASKKDWSLIVKVAEMKASLRTLYRKNDRII